MGLQLSKRQKAILAFIKKHATDNGYPPTIREIGRACDINSTSVVNYNLQKLKSYNLISMTPRISRSICLVKR